MSKYYYWKDGAVAVRVEPDSPGPTIVFYPARHIEPYVALRPTLWRRFKAWYLRVRYGTVDNSFAAYMEYRKRLKQGIQIHE